MRRYSNRPTPAEPLYLGTGDFEAVSYEEIPPAPRAPIFHRSMSPHAEAYGFGNGGHYPAHYAPAPQAPHSLSPMAMASARDAAATGPQRAHPTVVIRSRPTARAGIMILLGGALLGAVFGIGMRVRENAAQAAFVAQQDAVQAEHEEAARAATPPPAAQAEIAPVVIAPSAAPAPLAVAQAEAPEEPAAQSYADVPFGSLVVSPPASKAVAATPKAAAVTPKAAAPKASWGKPPRAAAPASKAAAPVKEKDDGYRVASAGNDEPSERSKASTKASAKPAREPREPAEPKRAESKPAKPSRGGNDEADKVLRAAMGATENTL
ncbi:MAG: hypothetical protein KF850_11375 [Labilithrix sp.]|nr:hypothetical protein [Labilithrix sp.]